MLVRGTQKVSRILLIVLSSLIFTACPKRGTVKIHNLDPEVGLVRNEKVIEFDKIESGEYGCAEWDDIRLLLELAESCK